MGITGIIAFCFQQSRAMLVAFLVLFVPFVPAFYYTSLNVETAMLVRQVRILESRKNALEKKNRALRRTLHNPRSDRTDSSAAIRGESWAARRLLESQVVRIRIAPHSPSP